MPVPMIRMVALSDLLCVGPVLPVVLGLVLCFCQPVPSSGIPVSF